MSKVRRYYIGRNRDHEKVMTEITDNDKRFIKIPDDEWVRATDYDEAEQSRDINHAAAKIALDQRDAIAAAALALVKKIDAIHASPDYEAVWTLASNRGLPYRGPNYSGELQALRAVLERPDVD